VSSSPASSEYVLGVAHAELGIAEKQYGRSRQIQALALLIGIASIFVDEKISYTATVLMALLQLASWLLRRAAAKRQSVGDNGRMRGLLLDALGSTTEHLDFTDFLQDVSERAKRVHESESPGSGGHFASTSKPGLRRLRDHIQENAFWNRSLYEKAATASMVYLIAYGAAAAFVVLIAIPLSPHGDGLIFARLLVAALAFAPALAQVSEILAWRAAQAKIEAVDRRLERLAPLSESALRGQSLDSIFAIFADYTVATCATPPIPQRIYRKHRDSLNRLWSERSALRNSPVHQG
jgi:hypothetical protein